VARRALGMGYLTWESNDNFGLCMLFLLLVVIGCQFCVGGAKAKGKELGVDYQ